MINTENTLGIEVVETEFQKEVGINDLKFKEGIEYNGLKYFKHLSINVTSGVSYHSLGYKGLPKNCKVYGYDTNGIIVQYGYLVRSDGYFINGNNICLYTASSISGYSVIYQSKRTDYVLYLEGAGYTITGLLELVGGELKLKLNGGFSPNGTKPIDVVFEI